jgi:hypothetical protein
MSFDHVVAGLSQECTKKQCAAEKGSETVQ